MNATHALCMEPEVLCMPEPEINRFVRTLNGMGYMTSTLDPISSKFLQFCSPDKTVLEIGAAYGTTTIQALESGAKVIANDMDHRHLEILKCRCPEHLQKNLSLSPGEFPDTLEIAPNSIDAILICRALHFFTGPEIGRAVCQMRSWLVEGGRIFIVAETPYLRSWQSLIPACEARKSAGERWPGYKTNATLCREHQPPCVYPCLNHLDEDVLSRTFHLAGLDIIEVDTINRTDFPADIQLDGRESVGIIGEKRRTTIESESNENLTASATLVDFVKRFLSRL